MLNKIMIPRIHAFHANLLPNTEKREVSDKASNIPARVPEGHRYLQKTGVSLTHIGRMITIMINMRYFSFLSSISPLKVFIFFGKGSLFKRSWIKPKGHKNPQISLPKMAPKNRSSPTT